MATILTTDDLDAYGDELQPTAPRRMLDELLGAIDEDRIAEREDVAYALSLASSAAVKLGDREQALELAARGVEVSRGLRGHDISRGEHAELLLRYGHEDEGMALLRALRPRLSRELLADGYVLDPLTENGRHELALEWASAALATALEVADRAEEGSEQAEDAYDVADRLLLRRYDIRRELDLPLDESDRLAEQVDDDGSDLLFWPETAFTTLVTTLPEADEVLPPTWDEHRADIERGMQDAAPTDLPLLEIGTPEMLAAVLADEEILPTGLPLAWPPGRNDPCWCGSRAKYKKCCLPRGRA